MISEKLEALGDIVREASLKIKDADKRFADWMDVTFQDYNDATNKVADMVFDSSMDKISDLTDSLITIASNIHDKIDVIIAKPPMELAIAKFKTIDRELKYSTDKIVTDFHKQQQLYYPQMLSDDGNILISKFKIVDMDEFNSIFNK